MGKAIFGAFAGEYARDGPCPLLYRISGNGQVFLFDEDIVAMEERSCFKGFLTDFLTTTGMEIENFTY